MRQARPGVRIIAGEWRGRRIATPDGEATRPTADRARETAFSMLTSRLGGFTGLHVADLFAGSGALGLEALSRGAASCLFVDSDRRAIDTIRANADLLGANGATLSLAALPQCVTAARPFDLIFADPPYHSGVIDRLLTELLEKKWTHADTMLCLETTHDEAIAAANWALVTDRKVGKALLRFLKPEAPDKS